MVTGVSALTAAVTWTAGRVRAWRAEKAETARRNWHGYLMPDMINEWYVRLADDDQAATGRVVLEVLDRPGGTPDAGMAYTLRLHASQDGQLARVPTPAEYAFLIYLRKKHHYGPDGVMIR